jgi:hypothetical protein
LCGNSSAQQPEWLNVMKKIKPLKDNRETVRKIYGKPVLVEENRDFFNTQEGRLVAEYSNGECSAMNSYGLWQVTKDIVISLSLGITEDIKFSSNKFNLKGFRLTVPNDTPQLKIYTNNKLGMRYVVQFRDFLSDVDIEPSRAESNLRCKN